MINPIYTASLSEQQRAWFYAEYQQASKDEVIGVLLALFLGGLGIHKFYLGQTGAGILYLVFCWTGIPAIIGLIECFFMPGRVRAYNEAQAQYIAAQIAASGPPVYAPGPPAAAPPMVLPAAMANTCPACGGAVQPGAAFCAHCGAAVAAAS